MRADETGSSSIWSREQDKAFENALATYPEDSLDRWEKISADVQGKSLEEIKHHYELLVDDINRIESGCVPLPCYNSSSDGSTSHTGDEGSGKRGGQLGNFNSDPHHGSKGSRSDQERRKGIAWTEDEHRAYHRGRRLAVLRSVKDFITLRRLMWANNIKLHFVILHLFLEIVKFCYSILEWVIPIFNI